MRKKIQNSLLSVANSIPIENLIKWSGYSSVFPFYHTVSDRFLPHIAYLYRVRKSSDFERDLDQMLRWFEPVGLSEYLEHAGEKKAGSGKRQMVLTFDDGLKECYGVIAPILKRKGIPAVFFLNNRFIDNKTLFFRYKASLLIHQAREDCRVREGISEFLKIPQEQIERSILMIDYSRRALLDALARVADFEFTAYLHSHPVYMTTEEIDEMISWGFDIGGHSADHIEFNGLDPEEMIRQVIMSMDDLKLRFGITKRFYAFPFTSDGVPRKVIDALLEEHDISALMGTAGMKRTGNELFIQRIPMEHSKAPAMDILKAEYLYYLLKMPMGRNRLRY